MKATNLVAVVLFILLSSISSWLIYNVSEFTQLFPVQAIHKSFDLLQLVQIWQISGCLSKTCVIDPGEIFTIHGLWPALNNGSSVIDCEAERFNKTKISKLEGKLKRVWPSLYSEDVYPFWRYQWNKHGGYTRFPLGRYFETAYNFSTKFDFLGYLERNGESPIRPGATASVDGIIKALEAGLSNAVGKNVTNIVRIQCIETGEKYVLNQIFLCIDAKGRNLTECPTRTMCSGRPLIPAKSDLPSPPPPPPPPLPSIAGTVATINSSLLQAY